MSDPAIAADGLAKRYGRVDALRDVDLQIRPGERVALVGHNGAGKTTLFKLMLGLIAPTAGRISVLGARPQDGAGARQRGAVGFLPENVAFEPGMTGRETLAFFARLKGVGRGELPDLLARVGLDDSADRRVGGYSKGMRQRLGLAQALLGRPELLLLDEPTTGLDPIVRGDFYDIVAELQGRGVTVVISSHVLSELEGRTDRAVILHQGRVAADGTLDAIRRAAGIEARIRARVAEGAAEREVARLGWANGYAILDARTLELRCPPGRKMDAIRALAASDAVEDIESLPPSLEQIYRHYTDLGNAREVS
jgi:Cu-processing system ATP-binding protein